MAGGRRAVVTAPGELVLHTAALVLNAGGSIDLTDNKMVIVGGAVGTSDGGTYSGLRGLIQSAHNGGAWDRAGITTSTADALGGLTALGIATAGQAGYAGATFGGVSVSATDALIMYTYGGDANLDGLVSGDDYTAIDFHVQVPGGSGWFNGDFNYDGIISGDDYTVIDFNILAQGATFPTTAAASESGVVAVPEPTNLSAVLANLLLLRRRRAHRRRIKPRNFCHRAAAECGTGERRAASAVSSHRSFAPGGAPANRFR